MSANKFFFRYSLLLLKKPEGCPRNLSPTPTPNDERADTYLECGQRPRRPPRPRPPWRRTLGRRVRCWGDDGSASLSSSQRRRRCRRRRRRCRRVCSSPIAATAGASESAIGGGNHCPGNRITGGVSRARFDRHRTIIPSGGRTDGTAKETRRGNIPKVIYFSPEASGPDETRAPTNRCTLGGR